MVTMYLSVEYHAAIQRIALPSSKIVFNQFKINLNVKLIRGSWLLRVLGSSCFQ